MKDDLYEERNMNLENAASVTFLLKSPLHFLQTLLFISLLPPLKCNVTTGEGD